MKKVAEDKLGIRILGPTYFGARQIGLKSSKEHWHQHRPCSAFAESAGAGRFYGLR